MTKGAKTVIVITTMLAIGGFVGYLLWKQKKDKDKTEEEGKKDETKKEDGTKKPDTTPSPTPNPTPVASEDAPLDVVDFQRYAMKRGFDLSWKDKDGTHKGDDGVFGSRTRSAWDKLQNEYKKQAIGYFKAGDQVYPKFIYDTAYNNASTEDRYKVGSINKSGAKSQGVFVKYPNAKGWIIARVVVNGYDSLRTPAIKEVFLQEKNYTNQGA